MQSFWMKGSPNPISFPGLTALAVHGILPQDCEDSERTVLVIVDPVLEELRSFASKHPMLWQHVAECEAHFMRELQHRGLLENLEGFTLDQNFAILSENDVSYGLSLGISEKELRTIDFTLVWDITDRTIRNISADETDVIPNTLLLTGDSMVEKFVTSLKRKKRDVLSRGNVSIACTTLPKLAAKVLHALPGISSILESPEIFKPTDQRPPDQAFLSASVLREVMAERQVRRRADSPGQPKHGKEPPTGSDVFSSPPSSVYKEELAGAVDLVSRLSEALRRPCEAPERRILLEECAECVARWRHIASRNARD